MEKLGKQYQEHHILPRSKGGGKRDNLKVVPVSYHRAYHHLFGNMTPKEIHKYLDRMWFTTDEFISPEDWKH